ncbi:hypothetical protein I204_07787 [Kwoniella mangroviensis CBS 8886]|uniref:hypothetical protein n=1 Tax=Kwoniella mangroviensis CBS 8507 TaxID=1296122 RepID=UPI00080CF1EA|nr:uncharacterized protein I203_05228 [Kwoniella mangroviensis CBS 8507]OCF65552.1 hypothetical protein I203_05228 [Kwoniella mangroviensis CBS 8507]OCF71725.1 hypothetical protein I204_07787 [Kwoniella mangroviensis CBS 8886]
MFNILTLGALVTLSGVVGAEEKRIGGVLAGAPVNNITVSADNVIQCSQATISWTGTSNSPYTLSIGQGGYYVGLTTLETHEGLSDSSFEWTVTQPSGQDLIFEVQDSAGQKNYIQNVKVGESDDSSCLPSDTSSSSVASSTSSGASQTQVAQSASVVEGSATSSSTSSETQAEAQATSTSKSHSHSSHSTSSSSSNSNTVPTPSTTISLPTPSSASAAAASNSSSSPSSGASTAPLAAASEGATSSSTLRAVYPAAAAAARVLGLIVLGGWLI